MKTRLVADIQALSDESAILRSNIDLLSTAQTDVMSACEKLNLVTRSEYFEPSNMALGDWLDIWMKDYLKDVKPRTVNSYCSTVRNHIKPALGRIRLKALTPVRIQMFINELYKGEGGLSAKTFTMSMVFSTGRCKTQFPSAI